ncbi:MAG: hypothetical protein WAX77_15595 [Methylococcaceae bacterium]
MRSGKLDEAEQETCLALKKSNKNVDFLNLLGVILKRKNQLPQAITTFKQVTALNPRLVSP